jgi:hypothetical protein
MVLVSGAFLAIQVKLTEYPDSDGSAAGRWWFVIGVLLLWGIYRKRSRGALFIVVATSLAGAAIYALGASGSARHAFLTLAYLGQALPLLTLSVRAHVYLRLPPAEQSASARGVG